MGKFNRRGDFGGGKRFSGRDGGFDRPRPEMHKAVCAECGDECEVPFRPSGDRPVLCSNCFKNSGHGEDRDERRSGRREERRDFDRPKFGDKKKFDAVCAKCGQSCQVPFRPRPDKDVFCEACFNKEGKSEARTSSSFSAPKSANYDKQFEALHAKLNKILELLNPKIETSAGKPISAPAKIEAKAEKKSPSAKATGDKSEDKKEKKVLIKKKIAKKK